MNDKDFSKKEIHCLAVVSVNPWYKKKITHLKLCLATATHNFKWLKITQICLIWDQTILMLKSSLVPNNRDFTG